MLKSSLKIAFISSFLSLYGFALFPTELLFNASESSMMGYKLGENIPDIQTNNYYMLFLKNSKESYYYVITKDKKQMTLRITVDNNNNILDIYGSYQYDNLKDCNNIIKKIYDNNIDVFPLKQIGNVDIIGYTIDGAYGNYKFRSFCVTSKYGKVFHISNYMERKSL